MKKILNILIAGAVAVTMVSCEDFLDVRPVSQGIAVDNVNSDSTVYASGAEAESALAGVYAEFRNEYWELDYFVNSDAISDDAYAGADNAANFQIDEFRIDAINSNVSRDWAYLYGTIGRANEVINNVEDVTDLSQQRIAEIKGEASFIRAFHYFQLVQLWGDVPLQLVEIRTVSIDILDSIYPIMFPARAPQEEVYGQIIADLELAAETTPANSVNKGFVTQGAANAMLAKVYATKVPHEWDKVLEYTGKVVNGPYSLLDEYDWLWDGNHENSSESIFEINYEGTSSSGNWGASMFLGTDWKKFNTPSNDLVQLFESQGDEIRLNASISFQDVSGKWTDPYWPSASFPFAYKYRNISSPSPQNYIFLRLADIMLLRAEALNETGDQSGAADLVNEIRERVDLNPVSVGSQEQMRYIIARERRMELAFEGHRWFDLMRTGRALQVMSNVTGPDGQPLNYPINEDRLWFPIPQSELDNNTKLVQNPGY